MKKLKYIDFAEKLEKDIKENYNSGDLYLSISALNDISKLLIFCYIFILSTNKSNLGFIRFLNLKL